MISFKKSLQSGAQGAEAPALPRKARQQPTQQRAKGVEWVAKPERKQSVSIPTPASRRKAAAAGGEAPAGDTRTAVGGKPPLG